MKKQILNEIKHLLRNQAVMALEIFPDLILALQTQLTMPIFVYKYFKLNVLVSKNIVF